LPTVFRPLTRQHRSSNILKVSTSRCPNSFAPRKVPWNHHKSLRKATGMCRNRPRSMSPGGTMLRYPLTTSRPRCGREIHERKSGRYRPVFSLMRRNACLKRRCAAVRCASWSFQVCRSLSPRPPLPAVPLPPQVHLVKHHQAAFRSASEAQVLLSRSFCSLRPLSHAHLAKNCKELHCNHRVTERFMRTANEALLLGERQ